MMIKETIQQDDITIVNIYASNIEPSNYVKKSLMEIKGEIYRNIVIARDFNTLLISMNKSPRQKINKEMATLNDALDWIDLIDIFRAFHAKAAEYTFFSNVEILEIHQPLMMNLLVFSLNLYATISSHARDPIVIITLS